MGRTVAVMQEKAEDVQVNALRLAREAESLYRILGEIRGNQVENRANEEKANTARAVVSMSHIEDLRAQLDAAIDLAGMDIATLRLFQE